MTPEKQVQNQIINYLKQLEDRGYPIFFERRQAGGFNYKKGLPDIYVVYDGIHIEVEIKQENGKRSIMQEKWEMIFKNKNILYCCVYSVNEFKDFMKNQFKM